LPVEQPTAIELWVNRKTAAAIDVEIPGQIEQLADQVIE
jgi:hypothetical protein